MLNNVFQIPAELWTVRFRFQSVLRGDMAERLSEALEDLAVSVLLHNNDSTDGDDWSLMLTTDGRPDAEALRARIEDVAPGFLAKDGIFFEPVVEKDWLRHVHDNFPPVTVGSFFIYGSHYADSPPKNRIPLHIDAATAFGSGEHDTTKGCLLTLEHLKKQGRAFHKGLDMGCGSGILAIAMTKLWPTLHVTAVDIDPESVAVTNRHAALNRADTQIAACAGDGYHAPGVLKNGPYDLIVANILAGPLIEMAKGAQDALKQDGVLVLSGLLRRQGLEVTRAHADLGLRVLSTQEIGDWMVLAFQKKDVGT